MVTNSTDSFDNLFTDNSFELKNGQVLLTPEDNISDLYLLEKGSIKQYVITPSGIEITMHIFRPLSLFPIMSVLSGVPNRFYFETVGTVELKKAPTKKILEFTENNPLVLLALTKRFSKAIDGLTKRLEIVLSEEAENRVASLLLYLSGKFGEKTKDGLIINMKITHSDIASWVGLSRETVSRKLSLLKKSKVIDYNKKLVTIKNPRALKKLSSKETKRP